MKNKTKIILSVFFIIITQPIAHATIRIVLTAGLVDKHYDIRKDQYIKAFNRLYELGYGKDDFYIVEAVKKSGPTFLDEYCSNVYYAQNNNPSYHNNGINEGLTFREALYHFGFDDNDMIIKMTGRYYLKTDNFFKTANLQSSHYDAIVKRYTPTHVEMSLIGIQCKYFKEALAILTEEYCQFMDFKYDSNGNVTHYYPIEYVIANYMRTKPLRELHVKSIDVIVDSMGTTTCPFCTAQIIHL